MKLSLVTIAFNEERDLPRCLDSAGFADEVVVVDSGSTDGTVEAARSRGAKVFYHPFEGFSKQKQFAIDRATGEWILVLDADETAGPGLGDAVHSAIRSGRADAWRIRRRTRYMGRILRFGPWRGDAPLRLFRRGFADNTTPERAAYSPYHLFKQDEGRNRALQNAARESASFYIRKWRGDIHTKGILLTNCRAHSFQNRQWFTIRYDRTGYPVRRLVRGSARSASRRIPGEGIQRHDRRRSFGTDEPATS